MALVLDGKTFADATMVIALGITLSGEKRFLGFVETDTENAPVLTLFLRALVERGLDLSQGVLVILDGGKGLRAAVRKAFRGRALVQRCQWHKRENVVSYLGKHEQVVWRQRLQRAYNRPDYNEAIGALETLHRELDERNQSAAGSLAEGLDETVTLHRLGLFGVLGRSLKTTNGLESVNALVEERCAKVESLAELEPTPALAGDRAPGHRTTAAEGGGVPPLAQAPGRVEASTEDRHDDGEKDSRLAITSRGEFQLRMGLTQNGAYRFGAGELEASQARVRIVESSNGIPALRHVPSPSRTPTIADHDGGEGRLCAGGGSTISGLAAAGDREPFGPQAFQVRPLVRKATGSEVFENRGVSFRALHLASRGPQVQRGEVPAAQEIAEVRGCANKGVRRLFHFTIAMVTRAYPLADADIQRLRYRSQHHISPPSIDSSERG